MKRRHVRMLLVFLPLGAMVNVAVAWGFALLTPPYWSRASGQPTAADVHYTEDARGWPLRLLMCRPINRGLCPACACPIGENPICTECGSPLRLLVRERGQG